MIYFTKYDNAKIRKNRMIYYTEIPYHEEIIILTSSH